MKVCRWLIGAVLGVALIGLAQVNAAGSNPSQVKPVKFAPGIISTDAIERDITFSPDGKTVYFARYKSGLIPTATIYVSHYADGKWSDPEAAPFSGTYNDGFPCVSPDGTKLYFASNRPVNGSGEPKLDLDIWVTEKTGNGWGEPRNLGAPVNTGKDEVHPSVAADGKLVWCRHDSSANWNIYGADLADGAYREPQKLGPEVNSPTYNFDPFIASNGEYIIFTQYNFDQGDDLFISFYRNGAWSQAQSIDAANTAGYEVSPFVSRDGKTLYFSKNGDFYRIELGPFVP